MNLSLTPQRCLSCGEPTPWGPLCRACRARYQVASVPDPGLGRCPVCGQVRLAEADRCVDCASQDWSFSVAEGLFGYQEPGGELLRLYKFGGQPALALLWAEAASRLEPRGPLVPVPPLGRHLRRRGWDPVATLAEALGRRAGLPVWKILVRRPTASQKSLDRGGRAANARKAYALAPVLPRRLSGTPLVWLVDDVVTTGATVEACSRLLRDAGVAEVRVFCLGLH